MKKTLAALLALLLLSGCGKTTPQTPTVTPPEESDYPSRFNSVTEIHLSDEGLQVNGGEETKAVFTSHDIVYYEDLETYESGKPYGEGTEADRHTEAEAAAHTVVNITKPGAYRLSGKLSAGQIRVDLGDEAEEEEDAIVELILKDADITCTVAPAILFRNVYECDENASAEKATPSVDTSEAGANLILEGNNIVSGSHVAKIFRDTEGEKKLWKQDGAIYSYQSLNIFGPGTLELTADNEGLGSELHLTVNGGNIHIYSQNDGINTNEDGVSVTTINDGSLTIFAGLGAEGDGIDSNGYLVINGGNVVAAANPASDAGLDSDLGSYIHGGTVIAMGSTMDWAESDSKQVTMNLQFAAQQKASSQITVTREDGSEIFSFASDSEYARNYSGLILSHPNFQQGETYQVYIDGQQMAYTGNDVGRGGPGGRKPMTDFPEMPENWEPGMEMELPEMPEDWKPGMGIELPEGETQPEDFGPGKRTERPEGETHPRDFNPRQKDDRSWADRISPEGAEGAIPEGTERRTDFYMNDKVNAFSGVTAA